MEHALHLAAKHFVEDVSPTSASALLKKVKGVMVNATGEDDEMDLDALNAELDSIEAEIGEDDDEADAEDYDVADTVGKALAPVTQV
jgi:TATA-binding protein-associated factor Taf7